MKSICPTFVPTYEFLTSWGKKEAFYFSPLSLLRLFITFFPFRGDKATYPRKLPQHAPSKTKMIHLSTLFLLATPLLLAAPILPESLIVSRQVVSQKKGLGHNNPQYLNAFQSSISWAYDWTNNPGGVLPAGIEFVPML